MVEPRELQLSPAVDEPYKSVEIDVEAATTKVLPAEIRPSETKGLVTDAILMGRFQATGIPVQTLTPWQPDLSWARASSET